MRDVDEVEKKLSVLIDEDTWVLRPRPIKSMTAPAKWEQFKRAVADARVDLFHASWETVPPAVRELSEAGGVAVVEVYRVRTLTRITRQPDWRDGKQLKKGEAE